MADYYESFESIKNENYEQQLTQAEHLIGLYVNQLGSLKEALSDLVEISTEDTLMVKDQARNCERILHMAKNQLHRNLEMHEFKFEGNKDLARGFQLTTKLFTELSGKLEDLKENLVEHHELHPPQ